MAADGRVVILIDADTKGYDKSFAQMEQTAKTSTEKTKSTLEKTASGLASFGSKATKAVTLPLAAAATASVVAATTIDTSLTNVKKTVDGTDKQYQQLKNSAIEFSKVNAVGASQILDIQSLGAQLGYTIDELQMFGEVVSGLDIATNMDAETAGTQLAQFANITKMAHSESERFASTIVALGNTSATTEADISNMAMRIAAAGTQVGMSQADILGLAASLASMGVEAEAGGTAVSTIMSQIDKDIATGSEDVKEWAKAAGMSAQDFANAWKNDPVGALSALLSGMENATKEGGNMSVMLENLGIDSIRQTDIMKRMAGNSELVGKTVKNANAAWAENSALSAEVANRNESLSAKFEMLKNRGIAMLEKVGKPTADALLDIADAASPVIDGLSDMAQAFADSDKGTQQMILGFVGLAAAAGPVATVSSKLITAYDKITKGATKVKTKVAEASGSLKAQNAAYITSAGSVMKYDATTKSYVTTNNKLVNSLGASTAGMKVQSAAVKTANVTMKAGEVAARGLSTAMKTIAPIAALTIGIEMFTKFSGIIEKSEEQTKNLKSATDGLRGSMDAFQEVDMASGLQEAGDVAETTAKKFTEVIAAQAEFAQQSEQTWGEINGKEAALKSFTDTIGELAGKSNMGAEEQSKLAAAVAGYNEITGESVEIIDLKNGKLSVSTDKILANAEAWKRNAEAQALQQELVTLYERLHEAEEAHTAALENKTKAQADYDEAVRNGSADIASYKAVLDNATQGEADAQSAIDACNDAIDKRSQKLGDVITAQQGTADAIKDFINNNNDLKNSLDGIDIEGFSYALSQLGFDTATLNEMGSKNIQDLAKNFDGDISKMIEKCGKAGIEIPTKLSDGIYAGSDGVYVAADSMAAGVLSKLLEKDYTSAGGFVAKGMAAGIDKSAFEAAARAAGMGEEAIKALEEALGIASPSKRAAEAGEQVPPGFAEGIEGTEGEATDAAGQLGEKAIESLTTALEPAKSTGEAAGTNFAGGLGSKKTNAKSQASSVSAKANEGLLTLLGLATTAGAEGAGNFASGVGAQTGKKKAESEGKNVANSAQIGLKAHNENAGSWGSHLIQNFAAGIRGAISFVSNAASAAANAAKNILGHSVPKEGVLREGGEGEVRWGRHLVQNIANGMLEALPELLSVSDDAAMALYDSLANIDVPTVELQAEVSVDNRSLARSLSRIDQIKELLASVSVAGIIGGDLGIQGLISKVDMTNSKLDETNAMLDRIDSHIIKVISKMSDPVNMNINDREFGRMVRSAI